jgi:hypothetical protein
MIALLEVVEHVSDGYFEHVIHVLIEVDARKCGQVAVGTRFGVEIEAVAKREGVWVADGIIWVFVTCLRGGGVAMGRGSGIVTSILGNDRITRSLE